MGVEIRALPEPFGAIVKGWSPDRELAAADRETIERALRQDLVPVSRGHATPTDAELLGALCRSSGLEERSNPARSQGVSR